MANSSFLGSGLSFPILASPPVQGQAGQPLSTLQDEEKIRQSIWLILSTAPGERVMRGDFGCAIHSLVFQPLSDALIGQVQSSVAQALAQWEPRIDLLQVDAAPDADQSNVLVISIDYLVRATNSRQNLVYPFFLS
jgi:phage baseplate assembly protein W